MRILRCSPTSVSKSACASASAILSWRAMHDLSKRALEYHRRKPHGKLAISVTKPLVSQDDLSLAYTPGVAEPVKEVEKDPLTAYEYTAKGNLVAVISNGTAILGLGNRGALASKPVMEGKAALFKAFADVDVYDIEIDSEDPKEVIETVERIAPTFGAICLEDIKAPECFEIEQELIKRLPIPVFHDDQHGTAIVVLAGLINALEVVGKDLTNVRIVFNGAGAAAIAIAKLLKLFGVSPNNIVMNDSVGIVSHGRENLREHKEQWATKNGYSTLADALEGADVFIGVSKAKLVDSGMVQRMANNPIIFALANPVPEISYEEAKSARPDTVVATGRSDYPNQVNNVLGFPFIFRGALDTRATDINDEMKRSAVLALAALAKEEVPEAVLKAYSVPSLQFGKDYILPKPLDPRVLTAVAPAVAEAAIKTGVAQQELNLSDYVKTLQARSHCFSEAPLLLPSQHGVGTGKRQSSTIRC